MFKMLLLFAAICLEDSGSNNCRFILLLLRFITAASRITGSGIVMCSNNLTTEAQTRLTVMHIHLMISIET